MRHKYVLVGIVAGILLSTVVVLAGNLDPPAGPAEAGSQLYTLEDIYNRLNDGTEATKMTSFTEPSSGPTEGTMHTLDEIYDLIEKRAFVPKTGQTTSYAAGDDGDLEMGAEWPSPRFITGTTGIVTDTLTGLIWLKNANCTAFFSGDTTGQNNRSWSNALTAANALASGYCGLTDGSSAGDWRLPNVQELQSLIDYGEYNPALPDGHPFTGVWANYWSSTTVAVMTSDVWYVSIYNGLIHGDTKSAINYVWPVRDN